MTLDEAILIARLSVTATIHHLSHGGVASSAHVATSPNPVDPMADVLQRPPSEVSIVRIRRGASAGDAKTLNRLYDVRPSRVLAALYWLNDHNPYYADVKVDPNRLASDSEASGIPCVKDMVHGAVLLPEDKGPAPDQIAAVGYHGEEAYETGRMHLPDVSTDFRGDVGRLPESAREQVESGRNTANPAGLL